MCFKKIETKHISSWKLEVFLHFRRSVSVKSSMQDACVKQTIMRIKKIAQKIYMEKVHDEKVHGDLKKDVGIKLSIKVFFLK